jgi:hypothetical protein
MTGLYMNSIRGKEKKEAESVREKERKRDVMSRCRLL